jgi:regulator of replication initiation timing
VWRQLYGKPKEISPLILYLTEKLLKLETDVDNYKKVARRHSSERSRLKSVVKNIRADNEELETQNEEMRGRLDDETARSLMESISYLATLCRNNNLPFDVNSLPHYQKLDGYQINYLKSLMKIDCRS